MIMSFRQLHIPQTFSVHKGSTPGLIFLPCSTFTQSTRFWGKMQGFSYDLADERRNNIIFAAENVNVPDARLIPN